MEKKHRSSCGCNSKEGDLHPSLGVASTRRADLDDNADGAKPFFQPDLRLETWLESRRRRQEPLYVLVCPDGQRRRLFGRKIASVFWEACGGMQSQKIVSSNLFSYMGTCASVKSAFKDLILACLLATRPQLSLDLYLAAASSLVAARETSWFGIPRRVKHESVMFLCWTSLTHQPLRS